MRRAATILIFTATAWAAAAGTARAQWQWQPLEVRGFLLTGTMRFTSSESFEAITESSSGPILGGGGGVTLPAGLFVEVAAWRYKETGERVFLGPGNQIFRLGIPVTLQVTPFEITGGWRFRNLLPRVVPYGGAGFSSYSYKETSRFAAAGEDLRERFSGFHILGGAEVRVWRFVGVAGEVAWSSVADALGAGGVSADFGEDNLGGTSLRLKITVGR